MDRTEGSNFIDIGGGRRGFQDQNAEAGVPGTRVTAAFLNAIQEEIMAVIENAGFPAEKANWQQLDAAIRKLSAKIVNDYNIPLAQLNCLPWLPVISLTQKTPPAKPAPGDIYIVPDDGKGEWSDKAGQIAEWNGSKWLFSSTKDGHGIGFPDGSIYIKIAGKYVLLTDLLDKRYSQLVAPPADTFYVIGPSGSDNNSGLKPTPEEGFATIQGAINAIANKYITQGTVIIKISPGTYGGFAIWPSLIQKWEIIGDPQNPAAVKINAHDVANKNFRGCEVHDGASLTVSFMSFSATGECISCAGGYLVVDTCNFELSKNSVTIGCFSGQSRFFGKLNFIGAGSTVFGVDAGSIEFGYADVTTISMAYINYVNCECTENFNVINAGSVNISPAVCKFTGSLRGRKFNAYLNSVINLRGANIESLPGDLPGYTNTGAQIA